MGRSLLRKMSNKTRQSDLGWRYVFNLAPSLAYRLRGTGHLTTEGTRVLGELNRNGIAISTTTSLLAESSLYSEMEEIVEGMEKEAAGELRQAAISADDPNADGVKTFLRELLGDRPNFDPDSIFLRFALQDNILSVVNAYFGMYTRLRHYNVWHTFKTSTQPRASQLWHRDREDRMILKVFVYLRDVDSGAGPFVYAPGTHIKGNVRDLPDSFQEAGVPRTSDEAMTKVVPRERWITAKGARGTIIFADTHGFHKGGLARKSDRLMYTCMFTSPASESPEVMGCAQSRIAFPDLARTVALAAPRGRIWATLPEPAV